MSRRVSHSLLDPYIGPRLKAVYPLLRIPQWFPPEGIVLTGHLCAMAGAVGLACSTRYWCGGLLAAIGIVLNHTADCIDGTHARSTGQCRNGGELLDHFTDPLSFAYWLVGLAVSCERLDWGLAAVIILFATAVLTNIKAKLIGEFTLAAFGPTEFKTLLACYGLAISAVAAGWIVPGAATHVAFRSLAMLVGVGMVQLVVNLVRAVREVNARGAAPDTTEWITARSDHATTPTQLESAATACGA